MLAGHMSVAPRVKQALEFAAEDATRRGRSMIDSAGLMLGMVEVDDALGEPVAP